MTWFLVRAVYLACRQMFSCCIFTCVLPWCPNTCMHTHTHTHTQHTRTHTTHMHTHTDNTHNTNNTQNTYTTHAHTHTRTHNTHTHNTHMCMRTHTHTHTHTSPLMSLLKKKLILSGQGPTLMTSFNLNFSLKTPSSNKPQKRLEEKLQYKQ